MTELGIIAFYLIYTLVGFVIEIKLYGWSDINMGRAFKYFFLWPIMILRNGKEEYKKLRGIDGNIYKQ